MRTTWAGSDRKLSGRERNSRRIHQARYQDGSRLAASSQSLRRIRTHCTISAGNWEPLREPAAKPFLYVVVCAAGIADDLGKLITAAQKQSWEVGVIATSAGPRLHRPRGC